MQPRHVWLRRLLTTALFVLALAPTASVVADDAPPDLEALKRRLADPASLWLALWEVGEAGPAAAPLVPVVAQHLAEGHEVARRLAAEALGKIGHGDPRAVAALRAALPHAAGALEDALLRALVGMGAGVPFRGELPEAITYASTPCLRELEQAYAQKLVPPEEVDRLRACQVEAEAHARRLSVDRVFRLGEQASANVAARLARAEHVQVAMHWSAPFLLVYVGRERRVEASDTPPGPDVPPVLVAAGEVCQAVYRQVFAEHGAALGLRPLEDAFGGRPDLPTSRRSYADGFPIEIWLMERGLQGHREAELRIDPPGGVNALVDLSFDRGVVLLPSGRSDAAAADPADIGWAAAAMLLQAFGRQRRDWRRPRSDWGWVQSAVGSLWGEARRDDAGRIAIAKDPPGFPEWVAELRDVARAGARPGGRAEAWMPLARLLQVQAVSDAMEWAQQTGLDPRLGPAVLRAQAAGLALFLRDHATPERRACWGALLDGVLRGEHGADAQRGALTLRDDDEVARLDAEFRAWWRARFDPPPPPVPPEAPEAPGSPR